MTSNASPAAPAREPLAALPTPLVPLERTGAALGVELWCKRDDLTGLELTGNKVRKLEFLLADARAQGADTVITCGGAQSNHCRATAIAALRLDMRAVLLLRTQDPAQPPETTGNILLDHLAGAELMWIDHAAYADRTRALAAAAERVQAAGGRPYVIPEGGSNALGAWGYVAACQELRPQLAALPIKPTTIVHASGSGGTTAGLLLGSRLYDLDSLSVRVATVNVSNDGAYFTRAIHHICSEFDDRYGTQCSISADDIDVIDGYVGRGYALSRPEELTVLRDVARNEGILLDPVYTGKAFYALTQELMRDPRRFGERIVFLHTGGLFGLFAHAHALAALP